MKTIINIISGIVLTTAHGLVSCSSQNREEHDSIVSEWIGKELILPDRLQYQIQDIPVDYDFENADFKIVTFIDASGCTGCKMKLKEWDNVINAFKTSPDVSVNFLMVIDSISQDSIHDIVLRNDFKHPFAIDSLNLISKELHLPDRDEYRTFLLDSNDEIVAIGNPVYNPKVRDLYRNIIYGSQNEANIESHDDLFTGDSQVASLGVTYSGDTINQEFRLVNISNSSLTIQEIVPSCHCVRATTYNLKIAKGEILKINLLYTPDSIPQQFYQYIDVYFEEKEKPVRLVLHGFSK